MIGMNDATGDCKKCRHWRGMMNRRPGIRIPNPDFKNDCPFQEEVKVEMKIKAISLWQPWASLVAAGAKKYETRSWRTSYKGPLLICASAGGLKKEQLLATICQPEFIKILSPSHDLKFAGPLIPTAWARQIVRKLPFGHAIAIADLVGCGAAAIVAQMLEPYSNEIAFGDFSPGRWAWKLENIRAIEPFPVKGQQGLFEIEVPLGGFKLDLAGHDQG